MTEIKDLNIYDIINEGADNLFNISDKEIFRKRLHLLIKEVIQIKRARLVRNHQSILGRFIVENSQEKDVNKIIYLLKKMQNKFNLE